MNRVNASQRCGALTSIEERTWPPQAPPPNTTRPPTPRVSARPSSTSSGAGAICRPRSIRWASTSRPSPSPRPRLKASSPPRRAPSTAAPSASSSCTSPTTRSASGCKQQMEQTPPAPDQAHILTDLIRADLFEQVIQSRYLGTKRFSLEGLTVLIPFLDQVLASSAALGVNTAVLGMSHRGRLNVMTNTIGRSPAEIFARFEDVNPRSVLGGGDVKYHMGATGEYRAPDGSTISLHLVSNPSHLEAVDPVALGRSRAKQTRICELRAIRLPRPGRPRPGAAHHHARRRRLRRPGHPRRMPRPRRAARLRRRRHHPRHRQQPARLHRAAGGVELLALRHRHRQAPAHPHLPRQRGRPRRRRPRRRHRRRVPPPLPLRCRRRSHRLPPPRPQRSRRPHRHPAPPLRRHQGPSAALQALRAAHRRRPRPPRSNACRTSSSKARSRPARARHKTKLATLPDYWSHVPRRPAARPTTTT